MWGNLDVLVIDLPPGTGDIAISMSQFLPRAQVIIVTTPQEASLGVVRKGIAMFHKVNVPILGIVENMSYFIGDDGKEYDIFGRGGAETRSRFPVNTHPPPKPVRTTRYTARVSV